MQRYIFRELLHVFLLSLLSLLSLVLIGRGLQLSEMFMGLDLGMMDVLWLFLCLTPMFMLLVMPVACMLSVFLTFLKMNTDRELVALRAGGISLLRLLPAPLLFCFLCAIIAALVSIYAVPLGAGEFRNTILDIATTRAKLTVRPGSFNQDIKGITIFARKVDMLSGKMKYVFVEDKTKEKSRIVIIAPDGSFDTDNVRGEINFNLYNGKLYRSNAGQVSVIGFSQYGVQISLSSLFKDVDLGRVRPKEMSWSDLLKLADGRGAEKPEDILKAKMEVQKRIIFPLGCLVLGFFAIPLATMFEGVHRQLGVMLAMFMFFVFYALTYLGFNVVENGLLPVGASWTSLVIFFFLGLYLFRRAMQERAISLEPMQRLVNRIVSVFFKARKKA